MSAKPCLDCSRPTRHGSRCQPCEREFLARRYRARGTNTQRGYDAAWFRARDAAIKAQPWCTYCGHIGSQDNPLTGDHVIPLSQGGTNDPANVVTACRRCNSRKGGR